MPPDYYKQLNVSREATAEEIKRAFRRIARETHPDANPGDPAAAERFRAAAEAYEVLSDPDRRRHYDRGDAIDLSSLFGSAGFDDLLRSVFGDGGLFGTRPPRAQRGRDVLVRVGVTLEDVAFGADVPVTYTTLVTCETCGGKGAEDEANVSNCPRCGGSGSVQNARRSVFGTMMTMTTCPMCSGEGVVVDTPCRSCEGAGAVQDELSLSVEIPAGITTGTRLRLGGRGESGGRAGPPGDLFVEVTVEPHDVFHRDGDDLIVEVDLGIGGAALGSELDVPLIEGGDTPLEVPEGTQPGTVFTVKGAGVTRLGRRSRGDLHVVVNVRVPESLSPAERDLLAKFAEMTGETTTRATPAG